MLKTRFLAVGLLALSATSMALADFDGPAPLSWRWIQPTKSIVKGSPLVVGDTVIVAVGQRVFALDKTTGNQKWRFPLVEPIDGNFLGTPTLSGDTLVASADNKRVYGIDLATGQEKWTYTAVESILGTPVTSGKYVVIAETDNSLMALDPATGNAAWERPVRMLFGITGNITGYRDDVLVMDSNFQLTSVSTVTQKPSWSAKFTTLDPTSVPVVVGDTIFINSGQYLAAVRGSNGRAAWQVPLGAQVRVAPSVSGDGIFTINDSGQANYYNMSGRLVNKKPIDLGSYALAGAAVAGKNFIVPTTNGAINLVDPATGNILWTYLIRPIGVMYETGKSTGTGTSANTQQRIWTIQPAGTPVVSGDTLLVLAKDGSLLAFDKNSGVDLTGPMVKMIWPNPGDQVSPDQLEVMFRLDDEASGIDEKTISITVDGAPLDYKLGRDGIAVVRFSNLAEKNRPLTNGRKVFTVTATDWLGNTTKQDYVLTIDRGLRPLVRPPQTGGTGGSGGAGGGPAGAGNGGG